MPTIIWWSGIPFEETYMVVSLQSTETFGKAANGFARSPQASLVAVVAASATVPKVACMPATSRATAASEATLHFREISITTSSHLSSQNPDGFHRRILRNACEPLIQISRVNSIPYRNSISFRRFGFDLATVLDWN